MRLLYLVKQNHCVWISPHFFTQLSAVLMSDKMCIRDSILLGLLKEGTGVASQVLADNGVEYDKVLELIEELIAPGNAVAVLEDGLSPRAAHVLEVSKAEAARFHSEKIGTEHLLIAMIKETECVASRLLNTLSVNVQKMYVDTLIAMGEDVSQYKDCLLYTSWMTKQEWERYLAG